MIYDSIKDTAAIQNSWTMMRKGNYIEYTYYTATEAGNPSGNRNLKELKFFDIENSLHYHILFEYDVYDNPIKQTGLI